MQRAQQQQQKPQDQDQVRERWEALVAKRLAEKVPEQQVVQELVSKGADIHLARDFVRRIAETAPEPKAQPQETEAVASPRVSAPVDVIVGLVLAIVGIVATFVLYMMDTRSWSVYVGYLAMLVGLFLMGRRALAARS